MEPLRTQLNQHLNAEYQEWECLENRTTGGRIGATSCWKNGGNSAFRQKEIDASIAARAEFEYLYDKPYEDRRKVRVAGPFTVESITPHRVLGVDENGDVIDGIAENKHGYGAGYDFAEVILEFRRSWSPFAPSSINT